MTNNINGIDVSECVHLDEWKHCNICKELIKTIPDRHQCLTEQDLRCEYYSNCYFKQLKRLQEENKRLQMLSCANCGEKYLSPDGAELYDKMRDYKDALEEIRKEANRLLYEENPIYGYNNSNYFEILAKYVLAKTKEVLNDRD